MVRPSKVLLPATSLSVLFFCTSAMGDPLVDIPTARKLTYGTYQIELAGQFTDSQEQLAWFNAGVGKSLEATIETQRFGREAVKTSEDLMYSVIAAIPGLSPGLAFGVQDFANTSQDGRRLYGVITFRDPTETFEGQIPLDLSIGTYYRRGQFYPFAGLSLPLSHKFKVFGEYDGFRPVGGIEFKSSQSLSFRLMARGPNTLADVLWTSRF
jgi:hypothetical protein